MEPELLLLKITLDCAYPDDCPNLALRMLWKSFPHFHIHCSSLLSHHLRLLCTNNRLSLLNDLLNIMLFYRQIWPLSTLTMGDALSDWLYSTRP
jgi:hypothetical protein